MKFSLRVFTAETQNGRSRLALSSFWFILNHDFQSGNLGYMSCYFSIQERNIPSCNECHDFKIQFSNFILLYPHFMMVCSLLYNLIKTKVCCVFFQILFGDTRGGFRRGRTRRAPPLKLEKIWFFWGKIVIFHTKYPKYFRASLRNWKKYDFLA